MNMINTKPLGYVSPLRQTVRQNIKTEAVLFS